MSPLAGTEIFGVSRGAVGPSLMVGLRTYVGRERAAHHSSHANRSAAAAGIDFPCPYTPKYSATFAGRHNRMFKLQRLEITGFKSFADYTEIIFTGNGITAVVGPNGCGKSNVSDAIAWVLGEQRAKSLRGTEMKDVVFQGTRNRKPCGMSEVVLHLVRDENAFDIDDAELEGIDETLNELDESAVDMGAIEFNENGDPSNTAIGAELPAVASGNGFHTEELEVERVQAAQVGSAQTVERTVRTKRHWRPRSYALDFAPGEAVAVTRRLYRSGESEYLLNGKTCRLRDIQDLFAGTGLSGAHYAIIEQGRIGQILSAKPADRRGLIEEAAGISKFRTRQRAAESRLETAKLNLGRISDIISEIEKQANSLRRQAAKTRRYVVLQEEFRILLRRLFTAEGRRLSGLIEELEANLATAAKTEAALGTRVSAQEEAFRLATHTARESEEALAEVRRLHAQNALERDRAEREHRYQSEQIVNFNNRLEALRAELISANDRLRLTDKEKERLEIEEARESAAADASRLLLVEAEKLYSEKIGDVKAIEADLEARRGELMTHTASVERFDEIARQLALNIERLQQRAEGLKREGLRAEEVYLGHQTEAAHLAAEVAAEREKLEILHSEKSEILAETAAARETLRKSDEELRALQGDFVKSRNRLETLQEIEEKRAIYAPQIQRIFAEKETIRIRPKGVLADFLNVEKRAEKAVESLLGEFLQSVIVETREEAETLAAWLRANASGRVPLLIAPGIGAPRKSDNPDGDSSRIEDILGVADGLRGVLRSVFPREMSAVLMDGFNGVDCSEGEILVNPDGDILIGGGLMISGRHGEDGSNASLLAFKRELAELADAVARLEKQTDAAAAISETNRKALAAAEEKTVDLQSLIIKVERGLDTLELQELTARQEIERSERHRNVVIGEFAQIEQEIAEIRGRIKDAESSRQVAEEMRIAARDAMDKISSRLERSRELAEAENAALNEKRTAAATSGERRRAVQSALKRLENERGELESRIALINLELSETEIKIEHLRCAVSEITARIAGSGTEIDAEGRELELAVNAVTQARESADAASSELAELNRKAAEARNDRAAIEVRQAEAVTELRNLNENCSQELGLALDALVESEELEPEFDLVDARARVDDLRQRLDGFGAINMLAVEELAETEERLLFLTSQRQDIIDSIASAEEALREIKERSRERFKRAFEAINANFMQFFSELFGGGRGEMTLLESDDVLEAGIEIAAQPPGKRLQNILLLSGGEKAMTAIALVLAIFRYRPSPFCLLDEVDAPLDEANVGRFVNKIEEMSEKTQFIVITHNKRTMEAARALYGVTMQEAGVSSVVSVKFE